MFKWCQPFLNPTPIECVQQGNRKQRLAPQQPVVPVERRAVCRYRCLGGLVGPSEVPFIRIVLFGGLHWGPLGLWKPSSGFSTKNLGPKAHFLYGKAILV